MWTPPGGLETAKREYLEKNERRFPLKTMSVESRHLTRGCPVDAQILPPMEHALVGSCQVCVCVCAREREKERERKERERERERERKREKERDRNRDR